MQKSPRIQQKNKQGNFNIQEALKSSEHEFLERKTILKHDCCLLK